MRWKAALPFLAPIGTTFRKMSLNYALGLLMYSCKLVL